MSILLCAGEAGLLYTPGAGAPWRALPCPLRCPSLLVRRTRAPAAADERAHTLWLDGRLLPLDGGVEALYRCEAGVLCLSGDTDCLTLIDPCSGLPLITSPAGAYPQDVCLLSDRAAAVCGGMDGTLRLLRLPELTTLQVIRCPGSVQRVVRRGGTLYALCACGDETLRCVLCRITLSPARCEAVASWPGLPGCLHAEADGTLWIAASETLLRLPPGGPVSRVPGDYGLIRRLDSRDGRLLAADPVLGLCTLVTQERQRVLYEGDVEDARFL